MHGDPRLPAELPPAKESTMDALYLAMAGAFFLLLAVIVDRCAVKP